MPTEGNRGQLQLFTSSLITNYRSNANLSWRTHGYYSNGQPSWFAKTLDTAKPNGQAGGLNLYAYCHNDPVNASDPSGLAEPGTFDDGDGLKYTYGSGGKITVSVNWSTSIGWCLS